MSDARPLQLSLLPTATASLAVPEGFAYRPELISPDEEGGLIAWFADLPLREFEFHGYFGKRRVVSYGLRYDSAAATAHRMEPLPARLLPLREKAAAFAGLAPAALEHALVIEYAPGAAIGWHRDRPAFGDVIGVSFASSCRFRFRRRRPGGWERVAVGLAPRSAYLLRGPARSQWEHSMPPAETLRYSVTFRTVRAR